ncbi:MAG: PepSY domain-containing protein [Gemmatimonadaceae bacterium]
MRAAGYGFPRRMAGAVALSLMAVAVGAQASPARALPTAESLLARHDSLVGGRSALESHESSRIVGALTIPLAGVEAPFEILRRRPNAYFFRSSLGQVGEVQQGFDGTTAWAIGPGQPPEILQGALREQVVTQADFFADFHDVTNIAAMQTVAEVEFEGRRCYEVKLRRLNGTELTEYFDAQTGLSAGGVTSADGPMGKVQQVSVYSDYREFRGIRFATRIVQRSPQYDIILTIHQVEFDTVDAAAVALPASVKALLDPATPR